MPPGRRWHFDVRAGASIYVVREGKDITSRDGTPMGAVKDVLVAGKEHTRGAAKDQALLVRTCNCLQSAA